MNRIVSIVIVFSILCACHSPGHETAHPQQLSIGIQNSPSNALVIIASKKHFFDSSNAVITIKEFSAGKLALQALLGQAGDLDIAVCAETPVALSTLGKNEFKVLTQIVTARNECRVVVRKDGALDTPEKYFNRKRKLATSQGGSPEWFTYDFINRFRLDRSKIEIVSMLPENMAVALSNGAVDAISIFDPYARLGEKALADKGLTFKNSDIVSYYVMVVKAHSLAEKPTALQELIVGLMKAEAFCKTNPDEARKIVAAQTGLDIGIITDTWSNYTFSVGLDSSFIHLCEAEAQWAITTGKYPAGTPIPDFGKVVSPGLLKTVNAAAVRL